ncbi:50S ribosomal protein L4 [Ancylobacter sp. 6x-1]|uniref:Large ribosomal subunit protein uL4 n=1 Tax=Ancylobacter crimeensis TaxID=2579147 RepID=A0ABT0DGE4_9HYPH|nr:50S ribosomal protein L4 [Ancylobacter crimeensis]MCK0199025.1 50S ribosomal protein L4 [Ancylobacter crimeensis]
MELAVKTLEGTDAGSVTLSDEIFGLEPRQDILHRCVVWQLSRRQAGTHQTLSRADVNRTKRKMYKQKGTGGARHGAASAPQFRGGAKAFGPVQRSHASELPKKVRALALKHALSSKAKDQSIIVLDDATLAEPKTKLLKDRLAGLGISNALVISGAEVDLNFGLASRNIGHFDVLPVQGINVYDILRRQTLVLTKAAVDALEARFK